jgi:NAD(P)-dependent dehydrogenase (short-subunit alcohol dehydrogenase family)
MGLLEGKVGLVTGAGHGQGACTCGADGRGRGRRDLASFFDHPLAQASAANMLPTPLLQAEDIANAVVWLMSDQAPWITGVALPFDAGATNKP